ncbi:MAG: MerR family transcriptional regulator, partial [Pseudomonadota bacterium]
MARAAARKVEKSAEAYRSIGEAAGDLGLQTHVLRYWEGKFPKLVKPLKRRDGRRMYRPADLQALRAIQSLVHDRGMTLKGAEKLLAEQGVDTVLNGEATLSAPVGALPQNASASSDEGPARAMQNTVREAFSSTHVEAPVSGTSTTR